jgi:hypothetical protein
MSGINVYAVAAAAVAAFVASSLWYVLFGKQRMKLLGHDRSATADMRKVRAWKIPAELVRNLVLAYVLARFVVLLGVVGWKSAVQLGVWLWIGFPFMILTGSVMWDNRPWKLAAIHAGDWLMKILLLAVILGVWR